MNVLDLFCGASGGWSVGLARAGYRTVAACELDDWRRSVFAAAHPGCRMYADVRDLTAERLRADLGFLPDIVVGSPPCQEISAANTKGEGITDYHLFWEWARLVFEIRPLWCGAENSPRARTEGIDAVLDALGEARYAFWPCVVGADDAGANHRRKRLWLIAADAERHELWQQPGRLGGTNGRCAAVAGEHGSDANGRLSRGARRNADGCVELGARAHGNDPQHAESVAGLRLGGIFGRLGDEPAQAGLHDVADATQDEHEGTAPGTPKERSQAPRRRPGGRMVGFAGPARDDAPDADSTRYALGLRLGSDDGAELPAALRDIGLAWPGWNGGIAGLSAACAAAGFGAVDDGSNAFLAPSLRNRAIAALGDAVIPQIPEAIGRAMLNIGGVR